MSMHTPLFSYLICFQLKYNMHKRQNKTSDATKRKRFPGVHLCLTISFLVDKID